MCCAPILRLTLFAGRPAITANGGMVEDIFRSAKSAVATCPIFAQIADETIRGHIFQACSLALVMRKELEDRLAADGHRLEWADIVQ